MIPPKRPMRAAMLLLVLCVAANAVEGRMEHVGLKKRATLDLHRELKIRQVLGGPGDVGTNQASSAPAQASQATPATTTAEAETTPATTTQTANTPFNPLTALIPAQSSSNTAAAISSPASVDTPASVAATRSSLTQSSLSISLAPTTRTTAATATSDDQESIDVVNVYSTALIAASLSSASASASAEAASASSTKKPKDDDSGLSKTSIITIVAIGSGIALIAAIWTIFRKWKLSPSRQFEDKLTPIDWTPEMAGAHRSEDKLALTRSNSGGSGVSSMNKGSALGGAGVRRQNSWGSVNGSMNGYGSRTDMAEIPYNNAMPAYPPANNNYGYTDQYAQQPQRYENLQRQPTGFTNGGRYGEGYRPNY